MKKISVIIPTHNRCELLNDLLASLQRQSIAADHFEIIVACDQCTDGTVALLLAREKEMPNLRWLELQKAGPAKARNEAAKLAEGEFLAFTDDDCTVAVDWLAVIWQAFSLASQSVVGLQGKTITYKQLVSPMTHQIENLNGHAAVPTCNAAYRKSTFWQAGGFDERFPFAHNEDADLAWQIERLGNIHFLPKMVVIHPPRSTSFGKLASRMKMLQSEFLLFHKSPELYREKRNASPWLTIYKEVFLVHQFRQFKSRFRFIGRPALLLKGLLLSLIWQVDLLLKFPVFLKADRHFRKLTEKP